MRFDVHPFKDIEDARVWARNQIDQAAGAARARYLTIAPGQEATYTAKYADAQAFVRAGYPNENIGQYPWVQKEAEATGATFEDAADDIKANGDPWNAVLGPKIEGLRIGGKRALDDLMTVGAVVAHVRQVEKGLEIT